MVVKKAFFILQQAGPHEVQTRLRKPNLETLIVQGSPTVLRHRSICVSLCVCVRVCLSQGSGSGIESTVNRDQHRSQCTHQNHFCSTLFNKKRGVLLRLV